MSHFISRNRCSTSGIEEQTACAAGIRRTSYETRYPKRINLAYDASDRLTYIWRYSSLDTSELVARTKCITHDKAGRLADLRHESGGLGATNLDYDVRYADHLLDYVTITTSAAVTINYNYDTVDQVNNIGCTGMPVDVTYTYGTRKGAEVVLVGATNNGDHVSTGYDRLGRTTSTTDQRGVVHDYTFDSAGRLAADTATSLGSSGIVDASIRRIGRSYDDVGRVQTVTSYSDTSGTTVVNQIEYEYNGWGRVYREYQEHDGAVDANSPFVQYDYEDDASAGVAKYVRLSQVTYPDGREVHYGYGAAQAIDDIMSRLATIGDATDTYASYKYLGRATIVDEDYEDVEVKLSYLDSSGNVTGLDRFGRVADQVWTDYGADPDVVLDRYTYTYDRAGNRTSRDNELHSAFDEDYTYDDLGRLTDADRADAFDQSWTLDGLGNFSTFDDDGTSQDRTVNEANQIQSISGSWVSPEYDAAGNMIFAPKSGDETTGLHFVRDAWNRQVAVYEDDGDGVYEPGTDDMLVAEYEFDGQNRRIEKTFADDTGVEYFYNQQWQVLEERSVDDQGATAAVNQYVWSPRYTDAPVVRFHDGNGDGDLLDAGDNTRYYTGDANFNVTATIDAATGDVVNRYVYSAYGEATVYSPTWTSPAAATEDGPLYCGYWFDAETGNFQVRAREYITCLSTFDATDPVGYNAGDFNLYAYCGDSPLNRVDPNGTWYWVNGAGEYCGPYVKLYTGWWCVKPNVWDAAMDAAGGVVNCWWKCEVDTHKTICGKLLTATEIISGGLSLPGVRIPKLPGEIVDPFDLNKGLLRDLARKFGWRRAEMIMRSMSRSRGLMAAAKGTFVTTMIIEAGISISCGIKCS